MKLVAEPPTRLCGPEGLRLARPLLDAMDKLHRATHVRVETVVRKGSAVREMLYEVITAVHILLEDATEARGLIKHAVGAALHNAVFERMILDTIQE